LVPRHLPAGWPVLRPQRNRPDPQTNRKIATILQSPSALSELGLGRAVRTRFGGVTGKTVNRRGEIVHQKLSVKFDNN
jgi:hypothetical protein